MICHDENENPSFDSSCLVVELVSELLNEKRCKVRKVLREKMRE